MSTRRNQEMSPLVQTDKFQPSKNMNDSHDVFEKKNEKKKKKFFRRWIKSINQSIKNDDESPQRWWKFFVVGLFGCLIDWR